MPGRAGAAAPAQRRQPAGKPNILVIFGDDIGIANISAYSQRPHGLRDAATSTASRREGVRFLHYYGEQSCTAGRAAFLTGQHGIRTGLTKVGFPGAPMGMSQLDPSIGGLLKNLGYATGQFGKNHVGDRNEIAADGERLRRVLRQSLPPQRRGRAGAAGLSEGPGLSRQVRPARRAALQGDRSRTIPTVDPRFGKIGKQTIEDTGALTKKRMETIDDETSAAAIDFMKRQQAAGKPFFCWFNSTRMHLRTHVRAEHRGRYQHGDSEYIDGMIEHDDTVGSLLKALDDMGIANNTIVVYTSDNGPHMNTWPDGAMTPFRSEKNTNWEGAFRVPCLVRWPGIIKPGTVTNELMSHNDWIPTLCAIAGEPDIVDKLKDGLHGQRHQLQGPPRRLRPVRVPAQRAAALSATTTAPRARATSSSIPTTTACSSPCGKGDYKYVFAEQRKEGTMGVWAEPFTTLRLQKIFNLMQDPFERADITSNTFWDWQINHVGSDVRRDGRSLQVRGTFKEFPPRSFPPSFNPANIMEETLDSIQAGAKQK